MARSLYLTAILFSTMAMGRTETWTCFAKSNPAKIVFSGSLTDSKISVFSSEGSFAYEKELVKVVGFLPTSLEVVVDRTECITNWKKMFAQCYDFPDPSVANYTFKDSSGHERKFAVDSRDVILQFNDLSIYTQFTLNGIGAYHFENNNIDRASCKLSTK